MTPEEAAAYRRRLADKQAKVFIRLTGVYGRVLDVTLNSRTGYEELQVMHDKDGTIGVGGWPLGCLEEVPEDRGGQLCFEREGTS